MSTTRGRPEHLRHFRLEDRLGKLPISAKPAPEDYASCSYWVAKTEWAEAHEPLDILACCPTWLDGGFTPPDDYLHPEFL